MSKCESEAGQRRTLSTRIKKLMAASAISGALALGCMAPVVAGGETRTISLYHIHTGESLTVTYMKDGRYIPSAMKQINYLMRDWRRNRVVTIDPRTIDLVWELHADLGSRQPVRIVCGHRSAQTNALLRRMGRKVARESQHITGKAIDFYFPDVPTVKIRNLALVRQKGGVGYYRSAGGPTGFLHADSGHVRHWGPYISPGQMAQIFRDGQKYVGRRLRLNSGNESSVTAVASAEPSGGGLLSRLFGIGKKPDNDAPVAPPKVATIAKPADSAAGGIYAGESDDLADLTADAAVAPVKSKPKPLAGTQVNPEQMASLGDLSQDAATTPKSKVPTPVADTNADEEAAVAAMIQTSTPIPRPRLKPVEIMLAAAANMQVEPKLIRINAASAPPPSQNGKDMPSPVADSLGTLMAAAAEEEVPVQKANSKSKSSLANELSNGKSNGMPVIKPMIASAGGSDINWWPQLFLKGDAAIRRDGQPSLIGAATDDSLPIAANPDAVASLDPDVQRTADGKGDLQVANTEGKSDLDLPTKSKGAKLVANQ